MKFRRALPVAAAALALALAFPLTVRTDDNNQDQEPPPDIIVNFGDPGVFAGTANQVVVPEDVTTGKGGTVTFVVNGPGHGIAIYPVSKNTTREDITAQLCAHDPVTARVHRSNIRQREPHDSGREGQRRDRDGNESTSSNESTIRRTDCWRHPLRSVTSPASFSRARPRQPLEPSCRFASRRTVDFSRSA